MSDVNQTILQAGIRAIPCSESEFEAFKAEGTLSKYLISSLDQLTPLKASRKRPADQNGDTVASVEESESK